VHSRINKVNKTGLFCYNVCLSTPRFDRHASPKSCPLERGQEELLYLISEDPYPGAKHCCKAEPPPYGAGGINFALFVGA
jgi:hypothetical protein